MKYGNATMLDVFVCIGINNRRIVFVSYTKTDIVATAAAALAVLFSDHHLIPRALLLFVVMKILY